MSTEDPLQGEKLIFNGINGATGAYLLPPIATQDILDIAKGDTTDQDHLYDLKLRHRQSTKTIRGVKAGIDALELSSAGWGIIFARQDSDKTAEIKEALGGLLDLRRSQAGELFKEFSDEEGYQPGEKYTEFLARHNIGPGPADPERVPYYLLIVGDPDAIPFEFQYQLDVQYAVGRIYFDTLDQYAQYAQSVVEIESGHKSQPRRATFFGVQNRDDPATQLSAKHLVQPLVEKFSGEGFNSGWKIQSNVGEGATKASLMEIMAGNGSPALFFSASHGMGFPKDDRRQLSHQGALLCQDWPGPQSWKQPIPEEHYFSVDDIPAEASFPGSIAFLFACYGAGTPQMDDFAHQAFRDPVAIAPRNFLARLPQGLLSHPKGGMQAVIGHVERAWGYSFTWEQSGSQLAVFESALKTIMDGYPVGYAMEYFNARYAELSTVLSTELQGVQFGKQVDDVALAGNWTALNDARSYVIIGDPAVRIRGGQLGSDKDKTGTSVISISKEDNLGEETTSLPQAEETDRSQNWFDGIHLIETNLKALEQIDDDGTQHQKSVLISDVGNTLTHIQLGSRMENIKAAIAGYQAALAMLKPGDKGDKWREIQIRLANSFKTLYEWSGEPRYANQAEQSYADVQEITAQKEHSHDWVAVIFNLAHLNYLRHIKEDGPVEAESALEGFEQILGEITRRDVPFIWAQTHYFLASLRINLTTADGELLHQPEAIENLRQALIVFTAKWFPYQFVEAKIKLGDLYLVQIGADRAESIELAIQAYKATLNELPRVAVVLPEASIYVRLGDAYSKRIRGDRTNNVFQALVYYKQSLASYKEIQNQSAIEELEQKITQLQSANR